MMRYGFPTFMASDPALATLGALLFLLMGFGGLYLAIRFMAEDEARAWRDRYPVTTRLAAGVCLALVFTSGLLAYDIVDPCSEEALSRICGSYWEWCWYVNGCIFH